MQRAIVEEAMAGKHALGILPTGTGKSLCYQIPAISRYDKTGALTVVISPLVALMADQVAGLEGIRVGQDALKLNGGTIRDDADRDAGVAHAELGANGSHRVDGTEVVGPAELKYLQLSETNFYNLALSPRFDRETTRYTASVREYYVTQIIVSAFPETGGTVTIQPDRLYTNTSDYWVGLRPGENEITVTASRAGIPDRTYTIVVTRPKTSVTIAAAEPDTTYRLEDVKFTVTRQHAIGEAQEVDVALVQDQSFLPASALTHTVTIPASWESATLRLKASDFTGGATVDGALTARIATSTGYDIGRPRSARVDLVVADPAVTVRFDRATYSFLEDAGQVTLDIVAETAPGVVISDAFSLSVLAAGDDDSAVGGDDYDFSSATVTFEADDFAASDGRLVATRSIDLTLLDDSAAEGEESFWIELSEGSDFPPAAAVTQSDGTDCASSGGTCRSKVIVVDDESPPPQVTGVKLTPGDASLTVDWTAVAGATGYKVQWKSGEETFSDAATDGREAVVSSGATTRHTISGLTAGTVYTVRVMATRTGATGDGAASTETTGAPLPTLTISDATATEGDAVAFTVTLSPAADAAVTVKYATSDGTATSDAAHEDGADYTAPASDATLTIAAGETSATISVPTGDDTVDEDDETFTVTLSDPSANAVLGTPSSATGTIEDNDTDPAAVTGVAFVNAPASGEYVLGDTIEVRVTFDTAVEVTGSPRVRLEMSGTAAGARYALYDASASTETVLAFRRTVTAADDDADDISVVANGLELNGGGIVNEGTTVAAVLDHDAVQGGDIRTRRVSGIAVTSTPEVGAPAPEGIYGPGEEVAFTVTFAAPVTVDDSGGEPGLVFVASDGARQEAAYARGSGTASLVFKWTVPSDVPGEEGSIEVPANTTGGGTLLTDGGLVLNGGTIEDANGRDVNIRHGEYATDAEVDTTGPALASGAGGATVDGTALALAFEQAGGVADHLDGTSVPAAADFAVLVAGSTRTVSAVTVDGAAVTLTLASPAGHAETVTVGYTPGTDPLRDLWGNEVVAFSARAVRNDSPEPALSIGDVTVAEDAGTATFTVALDVASGEAVSVDYATSDDSAAAGSDYTAASGTLTIPAGETSGEIEVTVTDDTVGEGDEAFTVTLSNPVNATIARAAATGTIADDETPTLTIADASATEGDAVAFTVTLSPAADESVTVAYATSDGTATSDAAHEDGADYTAPASDSSLTIAAGETSATITVATGDDTVYEADETFTVTLSDPSSNAALGTAKAATGTIANDDVASTDESLKSLTLRVDGSDLDLTPIFAAATYSYEADVANTAATVNVEAESNHGKATIAIAGDDDTTSPGEAALPMAFGENTVTVTVTAEDGETTQDYAVTVTRALPALAWDHTVYYLGEDAGEVTLTVTLTPASTDEVTVDYATQNDTQSTPGEDYTAASGTLTFAAGETEKTVKITILDDELYEPVNAGDVLVLLSNPTDTAVVRHDGGGVLLYMEHGDNDLPPTATMENVTAGEDAGTMEFTLSLSHGVEVDGLQYVVAANDVGGTATAGSDYEHFAADAVIAVPSRATSATFSVSMLDDDLDEDDETITIRWKNFSQYVADDSKSIDVTGTITDDDERGVNASSDSLTVAEGGSATYTVVLTSEPTATVTVTPSLATGSSADVTVSPASLSFTTSTWDEAQTVTVSAAQDADAEDDAATVAHTVAGGDYVFETAADVAVTVDDDETASTKVTLSVDPLSVDEDAAATTVTVTGALDGAPRTSDTAVTVSVGASGDAAIEGTDYATVGTVTLTIDAGETSGTATFSLTPTDDDVDEGDEALTVAGTVPAASGLSVTGTTLTIAEDDERSVTLSKSTLTVPEGGTATYTVVLGSQPAATVTVTPSLATGSSADVTVSPATLSFTTSTWDEAQTVTVSAAHDADAEDDEATVEHTVAGGDYDSETASDVAVTVDDDEQASTKVTLSVDPLSVDEDAAATTVTVTGTLDGAPRTSDTTVTVAVGASGDAAAEATDYATVGDVSLTIDAGEISGTATFSLTPTDDDVDEGDEALTVAGTVPAATGLSVTGTTLTIAEDDERGVTLSEASLTVAEGGTATYTVVLDSQPTGTVTVTPSLATGSSSDVTVSPATLSFTTSTWDEAQTVTVSAAQDADTHADAATVAHTVAGGDYGSVTASGVSVSVSDDDVGTTSCPAGSDWCATMTVGSWTDSSLNFVGYLADPGHGTLDDDTIDYGEMSIAGQSFGGEAAGEEEMREAEARLERLSTWLREAEDEDSHDALGFETRAVSGRDVLAGTSFAFTEGSAESGFGGVWGRGTVTRFDGREDDLTLHGDVESALLGADVTRGRWAAGLAVAHSRAEGGYASPQGDGAVESTLSGVYPYGRYDVDERLSLWGVVGFGSGSLTLTPAGMDPIETDMALRMVALGGRSVLVEAPADGGLELAATSDAMVVETTSEAVRDRGSLAASEADVTRLRVGLEGRWRGLGSLEPSFEIGVRQDGGDAETGLGADIGAGLVWSAPARGIQAEVHARGLLTHEESGFRERGFSGSLAWDPDPGSDLGPSLALRQTVGASATGGVDALLGPDSAERLLAVNDDGDDDLRDRRLEAELGYGLAAFGGRYTTTPAVGFGLSEAEREVSHGWRIAEARRPGLVFGLDVEAVRRERLSGAAGPEHRFVVGLGWRLEGPRREGVSFEVRFEGARSDVANDDAGPESVLGARLTTRW